ncbi:MAG: hypothetical protein N2252_06155 [Candidatus Kryptonium sp.]|nr:hypothetical protein [Candidatus Kryptonium sp.]
MGYRPTEKMGQKFGKPVGLHSENENVTSAFRRNRKISLEAKSFTGKAM